MKRMGAVNGRKTITSVGCVVWFVGLPGAGKSTYARAVIKELEGKGNDFVYLSMDEKRKTYFPNPQYTTEERSKAYRLFAQEAVSIARQGRNVIMDGTGPELWMRRYVRNLVPRFIEVMIRCPLKTAMDREQHRPEGRVMAGLYEKAIRRKNTGEQFEGLGDIVGVDVPFEENPNAECIIDSEQVNVEEGKNLAISEMARYHCFG